jgi:hypothetical protein
LVQYVLSLMKYGTHTHVAKGWWYVLHLVKYGTNTRSYRLVVRAGPYEIRHTHA